MKKLVLVLIIIISLVGCSKSDSKKDKEQTKEEPIVVIDDNKPVDDITSEPIVDAEEPVVDEEPQTPVDGVEEEPVVGDKPVEEEDPVNGGPVIVGGTATLSWTAPFTRENGDTLHLYEISHFVITHHWYDVAEDVKVDYSVDTYTFTDLPVGIHEFEIRTVDTDNLTSQASETVSKTIK